MTCQSRRNPADDLGQLFCRYSHNLEVYRKFLNLFKTAELMIFDINLLQIKYFQQKFITLMTSQNHRNPADDLKQLFCRNIHNLEVYPTVPNSIRTAAFMAFVLNSLQINHFYQKSLNLVTSQNH